MYIPKIYRKEDKAEIVTFLKLMPFYLMSLFLTSCQDKTIPINEHATENIKKIMTVSNFPSVLAKSHLKGIVLVLDPQKNTFYTNDTTLMRVGHLPASTFKIPHSIIALESMVIENDSSIIKWDGQPKYLNTWEQDLTLRQAFQYSCVPCYQEIAPKIGMERMNEYLTRFDYGSILVDSTNMKDFWLTGAARISPLGQIEFLEKYDKNILPISKRTKSIMDRVFVVFKDDTRQLFAKTGWSNENGENKGWYVGIYKENGKVYYFATHIQPMKDCDMTQFARLRIDITKSFFKNHLGISIP